MRIDKGAQCLRPRSWPLLVVTGAAVFCQAVLASAAASPDELRLQAEAAFRAGAQLVAKAPDKARKEFARWGL